MTTREDITIESAGYRYPGWLSVSVTRSIEEAVSSFSCGLVPHALADSPLRVDAPVTIRLGETTVLTGAVDTVDIAHDAAGASLSITGRSATRALVDCSHQTSPAQFRRQTLPQIARSLAAPYGIEVVDAELSEETIRRCVLEPGDTPWGVIERLARDTAVLVTDDPWGRLVLTIAGAVELPALSHPGDLLSAHLTADASQRYSRYICRAQQVGDDEHYGDEVSSIEALVEDDAPRYPRTLVIRGERPMSAADARRRATWEAVTRAGRSAQVEVTVRGWRAADGLLWAPNGRLWLQDEVLGVDAELLVVSATWDASSEGRRTTLTLAPPGAYLPVPPLEQKRSKRAKKKAITQGIGPWKELEGGV